MGEFIFCLIGVAFVFIVLFIRNKRRNAPSYLDKLLIKICKQFDEDNRKADINKLILLLKLGANPNQWITVRVNYVMDADWLPKDYLEDISLLDGCKDQAVKELLRAYGGKTTEELNALKREKKAEEERMRCIAEAEQKAKAENDLKKVKNFLSSKNSKA